MYVYHDTYTDDHHHTSSPPLLFLQQIRDFDVVPIMNCAQRMAPDVSHNLIQDSHAVREKRRGFGFLKSVATVHRMKVKVKVRVKYQRTSGKSKQDKKKR